jgi:hypothetical protein
MKKIYLSLTLLLLITFIWLGGTIYLLGGRVAMASILRGTITLVLLYLIVVLFNVVKLYRRGGEEQVKEYFRDRKVFYEKYYTDSVVKEKNEK